MSPQERFELLLSVERNEVTAEDATHRLGNHWRLQCCTL